MLIYNELDDINDYDNGAVIIKNPKYFKKGKNYVDIPLCFINKENVFEEINDIGRKILKYIFDNSLNKNNKDYHTIANQIYSENLQLIYKKYEEWNNNNGFPYSFKQFYDGDDGLGLFLDDCIFLSLCNEINIWLFKLQLGYDITNRFYNLISLLNMNMINETYYKYRPTAEEYYKITYDRVPSKEEIREYHFNIKEIIPNAKNNRKANEEVCNSLRKVLVDLINDKLDKNDYFITRLVPIFNQTTKEFTLYNKSNSVIGIAYYHLLLIMLNSEKPCKNPKCINLIKNPKTNTRYCDECKDKRIPSLIKSRKYDNSIKGKEQRHNHYEELKNNK